MAARQRTGQRYSLTDERHALAAVGRHGVHNGRAGGEQDLVHVLAQLACLGMAEPDPVTDAQPGRRRTGSRLRPASPEAIHPPPWTVARSGLGLRTTDSAKKAAGLGRQARYASNNVGP